MSDKVISEHAAAAAPLGAEGTASLTERYRRNMGSLLAVDDMVASLGDQLRENDEFDNTYFVFTSDNGRAWGAHREINKQVPYEASVRVPFVIAGPDVRRAEEDEFVAQIDEQAPTVLDLAGLDASDLDGRSLVPLLGDESGT